MLAEVVPTGTTSALSLLPSLRLDRRRSAPSASTVSAVLAMLLLVPLVASLGSGVVADWICAVAW
ncbi:hypothetical protein D3C81_2339550 [compost metagenome]